MQNAWIVSIGTELTLGQTVDTNAAWIARRLAAIGLRCSRATIVADDARAITEIVQQGAAAADVLIITGGLGPTADDLTREALAEAAAAPLELHAPSLERLHEFFAKRNRPMPQANRVQALIPRGAAAIANLCGTAPGIRATIGRCIAFALPGVPFEMQAMFERDVLPELRRAAGGRVLRSRIVRTYGMPESELGAAIGDQMARGRNPEVGTTADLGDIGVRINATVADEAAALALLDAEELLVRERLGVAVYGRDDDTLAAALGRLLAARGESLAVAESCTGGLLGALLTDVPGSSRYFLGGVISYADEIKRELLGVPADVLAAHGAVSEPAAAAMAAGVRERCCSTYALSISGIAGPDGGSADKPVGLVYIGVARPAGVDVREFRFGDDQPRTTIRMRSAKTAMNLLRRELVHPA